MNKRGSKLSSISCNIKRFFRKATVIALSVGLPLSASAQISVDTSRTHQDLVANVLLGNNQVKIANVKYMGNKGAIGYFKADNASLGIQEGLFLSTGYASSISGPNTQPNRSDILRTAGDADLTTFCTNGTYDAAILEFDFVPRSNKVSFEYIFASEEFVEFAGSKYNDVFGFFISGPAIKGKKNIAIIPGTDDEVSINTVNQYKNSDYFVNNNAWQYDGRSKIAAELAKMDKELLATTEFDGMTVVLTAEVNVIPYKKYHFKMTIADGTDMKYNSAVFLQSGSFKVSDDEFADPQFMVSSDINEDLIDLDAILEGREFDLNKFTPKSADVKAAPKLEMQAPAFASPKTRSVAITKNVISAAPTAPTATLMLPAYFEPVTFDYNSSALNGDMKRILGVLADMIKGSSEGVIQLTGHTDGTGSLQYNQKLSEKRANAVQAYLVELGVEVNRIRTASKGEQMPIASNGSDAGRAQNRRVEILLTK